MNAAIRRGAVVVLFALSAACGSSGPTSPTGTNPPFTQTRHVESDELLAQHTRYALIATDGLRDAAGRPVGASEAYHYVSEEGKNSVKTPPSDVRDDDGQCRRRCPCYLA
jgi:hypothetical protein